MEAESNAPVQVIFGNVPSKSNSYIIAGNRLIKSKKLTAYEKAFYIQCNHYRDKNIDGYFRFHMDVFYSSQRLDIDNSTKIVLDCMQHVKAIRNDNKCTELFIRKFLDKQNPRIEFKIIPV